MNLDIQRTKEFVLLFSIVTEFSGSNSRHKQTWYCFQTNLTCTFIQKLFFHTELSKYLERKEELDLMKAKKQHKEYIQSLGASKKNSSFTERKKKLEFPDKGKK